jgi:hypothetical protein
MAPAIPLRVLNLLRPKPHPVIFDIAVAVVCSSPTRNLVISTEGGAFAAIVEKSAVLFGSALKILSSSTTSPEKAA